MPFNLHQSASKRKMVIFKKIIINKKRMNYLDKIKRVLKYMDEIKKSSELLSKNKNDAN